MYQLGPTSISKLGTVEPKLQEVIKRAIVISTQDFSVLEGARSKERQYELYAHGRTVDELRKAGVPTRILAQPGVPKVTWTLNSNHFAPPGKTLGRAVDLGIFPYDPKAGLHEYKPIYDAVMQAAKEQGVKIRSGMDWDGDGHVGEHGETDLGHFELVG